MAFLFFLLPVSFGYSTLIVSITGLSVLLTSPDLWLFDLYQFLVSVFHFRLLTGLFRDIHETDTRPYFGSNGIFDNSVEIIKIIRQYALKLSYHDTEPLIQF